MKIKYFALALAALGAVACSEKVEDAGNTPQAGIGGGDKGYLAINLKSTDDVTRGAGDTYEDGTAEEQAISTACFFFFDAAGNPFNVNANGNYYNVAVADNGGVEYPNIESMTDPVLVVEKYKGEFPAKVVAVVNYTGTANLSLNDLKANLTTVGHTSGSQFIMTNSAYVNGAGEVVDATPLTIDHFQTSIDKAEQNPVTIYVERTVAKANVKAGTAAFNTGVKVGEKEVYAKVNGWDLVATQDESYFVKSIDAAWTDAELGFVWNDAPYFRSYWTGKTSNAAVSNAFTPAALTNNDDTVEYLGEHVNAANTDRTKYIVSATLQDVDGNAIEIAQWYGTNYIGEDALLAAVAPTLKNKLMLLTTDGGNNVYTSIDDSQLQCVAGLLGAESYEVKFQLAADAPMTGWYSFDGTQYTAVADVNGELAKIEPAKVWKNGQTYYYADVKHIGDAYGIVRNHSYKINVTGVTGWGTPVYDPNMEIETPVKPTDKETYISAEINVLSWRVVSNDVTLE